MARKRIEDQVAPAAPLISPVVPPVTPSTEPVALPVTPSGEPASAEKIIQRQLELLGERSRKGLLTYDETKALDSLVKLQMLMKLRASKAGSDATYDDLSSEELKAFMNELNRE